MRDLGKALFKLLIALLITLPLFPQSPQLIVQRFPQREEIPIPAAVSSNVFVSWFSRSSKPAGSRRLFFTKTLDRQSDSD